MRQNADALFSPFKTKEDIIHLL